MIKHPLFLASLLFCVSDLTYAIDLSGFYRCTGSKTLLDNSVSAPIERRGAIKIPVAQAPAPAAPVKPAGQAAGNPPPPPSIPNQASSNKPTPILSEPGAPAARPIANSIVSSIANDNALPLSSFINLRMLEDGNNVYVYTQMNDDGSIFWGKAYYFNEHIIANFDSSNPMAKRQSGVLELNIKSEDGTLIGRYFIETVLKGSMSCAKV